MQFPLGIGYLIATIKKDRPTQAFHFTNASEVESQLPDIINSFNPGIIGLTCTTFNRGAVRQVIGWLKSAHPQLRIIVGGVHASFQYEQVLKDYGADYVVIGEGEKTFQELCRVLDQEESPNAVDGIAFLDSDNNVIKTPVREIIDNLDDLPIPDYTFAEEYIKKLGIAFIITSRGCPVHCSFCSTSSYWGQKVRMNSPNRVVDEMEYLVNRFGVNKIFFYDDTFNLSSGRVKAICDEIQRRGFKVEWGASCRVVPVSPEMINMMFAAGCRHICWGVESGSSQMLQKINKKISLEQIRNAFQLCLPHMNKMSVGCYTMVGNPGENEHTISETVEFLNTLPMTDPPSTSTLYILPGTPLANSLEEELPYLNNFWAEHDYIPFYTRENTMEQLDRWCTRVSKAGKRRPFDQTKHFWNNILFNFKHKEDKTTVYKTDRIKLLLVYSLHPVHPKITLPEWIKETLRECFAEKVEVLACGPHNEIDIQDCPDFYHRVADLIDSEKIDIMWEIEGAASSLDFMFKRFPTTITIPKVYWAIDTHQYLGFQVQKSSYFDLIFSAQYDALKSLGKQAVWLPAGAALHERDYHLERDIVVGFVGSLSPLHSRRIQLLTHVKKEFPHLVVAEDIFLEEKAKLVSRMKIVINVSLNNDINFRIFETLACGALLITDRIYNNGLEQLFNDGEHLVTFTDADDLIDKIRYYSEHEDERCNIADAGKRHVLDHFTHEHIVRKALEHMETLLQNDTDCITSPSCWCGGRLEQAVHPQYSRCIQCGTHISKQSDHPDILKQFYSFGNYWHHYQEQVGGYPPLPVRAVTDFQDRIPIWYKILTTFKPLPSSILEIGCAHGGFLSYCREHGTKLIVGIEVDNTTCHFAKKRFDLPHIYSGLFPDVDIPFNEFEVIIGFDVIEHFKDQTQALTTVKNLLAEDGIVIFQTPCYRGEGADWSQFKPGEHLYLFNSNSIRQLFFLSGLIITEILPGLFHDDMFVIAKKIPPVHRLLYLRTDAIGDSILSAGILPHLRERYPGALITVVCQERTAPLYDACPFADAVIPFDLIRLFTVPHYRSLLLEKINRTSPDLLLNPIYSHDLHDEFLVHHIQAPLKITVEGDSSNRSSEKLNELRELYSLVIPNNPDDLTELDHNRTFLRGIGISADSLSPQVWITRQDREWAAATLRELDIAPKIAIMLFPGALLDCKTYPHYAEVAAGLSEHPLLICGGDELRQKADQLCRAHGGKAVNLAGQTSLGQLSALMELARLYLGSDSSGLHIACAVGLPNNVLLGGGHFGRFCPYSPLTTVICLPLQCYGCNWQCQYKRVHCLHGIQPDTVLWAAARLLSLAEQPTSPTVVVQADQPDTQLPPLLNVEGLLKLVPGAKLLHTEARGEILT